MKHLTSSPISRGFTLVEMAVTVAIFALITGVVLTRNAAFDQTILLNNLAYDVALSVRQAQQYGINVRASEGQFDRPYGIHFRMGESVYYLFADVNGNNIYDAAIGNGPLPSDSDIIVEEYVLGRDATVLSIVGVEKGSEVKAEEVNIVFKRPDPDAVITTDDLSVLERVTISVETPRGGSRYVAVESTGQISLQLVGAKGDTETPLDENLPIDLGGGPGNGGGDTVDPPFDPPPSDQ